jgi:hypothetical protein
MNDLPREPLHQPPDPEQLRARPPRSPACAAVRGLLRDSADGDLSPDEQGRVDEHVHTCRECSIALGQAEHEVLRLRRAFAAPASFAEASSFAVPPGFAARVVDRLVLDETSLLPRDAVLPRDLGGRSGWAAGEAAAQHFGEGRNSGADTVAPRRRWRLVAAIYAASMLAVLLALGAGYELFVAEARPVAQARLVITAAADTYSDDGSRLTRGDGLGDTQSLWVGAGGAARAEWHDASAKRQPAATLELTNRGEVRVQDGATVLVQGSLLVDSRRSISIPVADGSRIDLGVGEYLIAVDDLRSDRSRNLLAAAPDDLRVSVEVRRGDGAQVVRPGLRSALVDHGQIGVYRGSSMVDVVPAAAGGGEYLAGGARRLEPVETVDLRQSLLSGVVVDRAGSAVAGADVLVSFGAQNLQRMLATGTAAAGSFFVETGLVGSAAACSAPFAIVQALAPANRPDLGFGVPDVQRLVYRDGHARLADPVVLGSAIPVVGAVVDEDSGPVGGVRIVPCVVDEIFASVLVWSAGQVQSGTAGEFVVRRLPSELPRYQHLALLLWHEQFEPLLVYVPERGSSALSAEGLRAVLRPLRPVRLVGLPANSALTVLEDVACLPTGTAAVRRPVATDVAGEAWLSVGGGRLWLRNSSPTQPMLRELLREGTGPTAPFRPQGGSPRLFDVVFQGLQPLLGTELLAASANRFQRFRAAVQSATSGILLSVQDSASGRPAAGAQVFAVRSGVARGLVQPRFLGFLPAAGAMLLDSEPGEFGVVVLGADGSVAASEIAASGEAVDLQLVASGRILLDPSLRSGDGSAVAVVCERLDPALRGLQQTLVRFTGPLQSWEISGVPAGQYLVVVGGRAVQLEVPAGGQVLLR